MKRILLIDESSDVQKEIQKEIGSRFSLSLANSLSEARSILNQELFDLIVLEVVLSDGDGCDFCSELRSNEINRGIPIIVLTDKNSVAEKIRAFAMGADDFVVKPFEPLELEARMEARLRNVGSFRDLEPSLQKGDLSLSVPFQKASLGEFGVERDLKLTPTEFRLLYFFIKNEGLILTRRQLLTIIWSDDVHVLSRTIDKHISTLKKKLGIRASYIQSIHGKGYRFVFPETSSKVDKLNFSEISAET